MQVSPPPHGCPGLEPCFLQRRFSELRPPRFVLSRVMMIPFLGSRSSLLWREMGLCTVSLFQRGFSQWCREVLIPKGKLCTFAFIILLSFYMHPLPWLSGLISLCSSVVRVSTVCTYVVKDYHLHSLITLRKSLGLIQIGYYLRPQCTSSTPLLTYSK